MKHKISLEERFRRLESGCPSDPDYVLCVLKNLAQTPISIYLSGINGGFEELVSLLDIPLTDALMMSYCDVAAKIVNLKEVFGSIADKAAELLALPFYLSYEERRVLYAQEQENPT